MALKSTTPGLVPAYATWSASWDEHPPKRFRIGHEFRKNFWIFQEFLTGTLFVVAGRRLVYRNEISYDLPLLVLRTTSPFILTRHHEQRARLRCRR